MGDVAIRPAEHADVAAVRALWAGARSPHASTPDGDDAVARAIDAGALLVAAGERRLRECGAPRINALVDGSDEGVRAMWDALGYRADPATIRFVRDL
jgi:hypothetical protein